MEEEEYMVGSEQRAVVELLQDAYATHLPAGKGFLPPVVPLDHLPDVFDPYVRACNELPSRFAGTNQSIRPWLDGVFFQHDPIVTAAIDRLMPMQRQKLMTVLCTLAHTYR